MAPKWPFFVFVDVENMQSEPEIFKCCRCIY